MADRATQLPPRTPARDAALVLFAIATAGFLVLLLVPPRGDFPLNDDWIYARAVKSWMDSGVYSGHPFSSPTLLGQAWWGRLFSHAFGFSFTVLRASTIVLWLAGACATGLAALALRARPGAAALAGLLVIANPLAMNLGYTFMTDVPFMALMAFAGFAYIRALENLRWPWFFWGSVAGAGALLVRQFAMLLPLALVLALAPWAPRWRRLPTLPLAVALVLPWLVACGLIVAFPAQTDSLGHTWRPEALGGSWPDRIFRGISFYGVSLVYLGLFASPLAASRIPRWLRGDGTGLKHRGIGLLVALALLALVACVPAPHRLPFLGNLIYDFGVGPRTLRGGIQWRPVSIGGWWWIPTLLGLAGGAWMAAGAARWLVRVPGDGKRLLSDPRRRQQAFLLWWALFMVAALFHPWLAVRFDRYLLGALVPVLLMAAMAPAERVGWVRGVQACLVAALFMFSVASLQDYLAWNSARWSLLNRLTHDRGVPPVAIAGGYEFNGWYTSPAFVEREGAKAFLHSRWWEVDDTYVVSWRPRPGYSVIDEAPYRSWLAGDRGKLLLLRRIAGDA